jgi:hypothetical protein
MSFLQVMKSDQSKTEKRLNQLSNKVNDLYDYEDYDEDELLRNDGEGDSSLGHTNDNGEYDCDDNHEVIAILMNLQLINKKILKVENVVIRGLG